MVNRSQEMFREALRKSITNDIFTDSRLMDTPLLLHTVDADIVTKTRLSTYGQMDRLNRHMINRTEDYTDMEKARDTRIDSSKLDNKLDYRQIGLDQSLEEIYFNYYGHGANDSPVPDRPGAPYKCPCGTKMMTGWKTMPLQCPRCHRLTPAGELQRDGILKRA